MSEFADGVLSGLCIGFALVGLGFIAALAWRGTRPEPPPRSDYDEFTAPDYPPPDAFRKCWEPMMRCQLSEGHAGSHKALEYTTTAAPKSGKVGEHEGA